jgi:hypothetical protein
LAGLADGQTLTVRVLRGTEELDVVVSFEPDDGGSGSA